MAVIDFAQQRKDAEAMETLLKRAGLPFELGDAIAALAKTIRDHKHFERIITEAEPEERQDMYDAIVPHLKFDAWPLDRYVASAGRMAERLQLPTLGADGALHPFKPASDVRSVEKDAEDAIAAAMAKRTLTVVCAKCTRQQTFYAVGEETPVAVVMKARKVGWIYDYKADPPVEICPTCPTSLRMVQ